MAKVVFIMARPNVAVAATAFRGTAFQARSCSSRSRGAALRFLLPALGGSTTKLKYCPFSSYPHIVPIIPLGLGGGSITISESSQHQRRLGSSVRATNVNDSGSIDSPLIKAMENKIKEHLNAEFVTVKDAYGDGRHVSIDVISSAFEGESAVSRQRMVYRAIWEELQSVVHAVDQMTTKTPSEVAAAADK